MRMDLTSLQVFLVAVEEGNIGRAAERAHLAPSAISKRIQDLEAEFGLPLLHRNAKGVAPTAAGAVLAEHVRSLESILDRIRSDISEHQKGAFGQLRVHANGSSIVEYLADDLRDFIAAYPQIRVSLSEGLSNAVALAVRDGEADIGVFAGPGPLPAGIEAFPYRTDRVMAVVPAGHKLAGRNVVTLDEVLAEGMVTVPGGSSLSDLLVGAARGAENRARLHLTPVSNEALRKMVESGLGLAVLTEGFVKPYEGIMAIRGVPFAEPWATRQLSLCARAQRFLPVPARLLVSFLLNRAAARVA